jgi:hypothetical protein
MISDTRDAVYNYSTVHNSDAKFQIGGGFHSLLKS